jgi:RHS repeat-associated protein
MPKIGGLMFASTRTVRTSLLVLFVLASALGLGSLPSAAADDEHAVTVLRELSERRTEYGTTYLLSNGQFRTVLSQSAVHYKDADGVWQPIDTTLVEAADGSWTTKAAAVRVTFAGAAAKASAVTLAWGEYKVGLTLEGAAATSPAAEASAATYLGIAAATDAVYEATGDGLKETLVLASSEAPASFTFSLSHSGLTLRADEGGSWGLFAGDAAEPALLLGAVNAHDSSSDEGGEPAWCDAAKLSVAPGKGESTLTVSVPRAWLDEKARVYPVKIDPQLFTRAPTDAYISSGHPSVKYGQTDAQNLLCGQISQNMGTCKTLVRFPQVDNPANIPSEAHVSGATFSIRQYEQLGAHTRTHAYRLYGTCTDWGSDVTWNSMTVTGKQEVHPDNLSASGATWLDVTCPGVIQGWVDGSFADRGFMIAQKSEEGSTYARKFRSGEYDVAWRPNLTVDWEEPTVASDSDASTYAVGDTVSVTVTLGAIAQSSQITEIRMGVNRLAASTENRRGVLAWFADEPTGDSHWVYQRALVAGGSGTTDGFVAYYASTAYGSDHIEPLLEDCTISADHKTATFAFAAGETWGLSSACQMDTYLAMAAGSRSWTRGWEEQTQNTFTVDPDAGTPAALCSLTSTTTATSTWFSGTSPNDTTDQGRGTVTLSWPAVPLADSYRVYLWDGDKYDRVDDPANPVTGTSWTTPSDLYPTDSAISALTQGYSGDPFATYGSRDLRDNPNALYQRMAGSANKDTDYRFKVVPVDTDASPDRSADIDDCAPLRVTLDNRSVLDAEREDPRHVTCELDEWDGHSVGVELDSRQLTLSVSDLEIASWGPAAAVSRTFRSDKISASTRFAGGWFFNFEQNLAIGANQITFTDAARRTHTFSGSGAAWTAPNGFLATLAPDGSNWRLTFFDQSYLTFDSAGRLLAETDKNGNTTTYTWTSGNLTRIIAANGQYIELSYSSGALTSASYATAAGTRTVSYATAAPWQVTCYPSSAAERTVTYTYNSRRNYLMSFTQEAWPTSGQSATESFDYNSSAGQLEAVYFADYDASANPDAMATISYGTNEATIVRHGSVDGIPGQTMNQEVYVWSGAAAGVPNQLATYTAGSGALAATETYNYAFDRQLATTTSSEGGQTNTTIDLDHNATSETQTTGSLEAANQTRTSTYDALHRLATETSYQSPTIYALTTNTYTGANLTATKTEDQDAALLSAASYAYDSAGTGLLAEEKNLVCGTIQSGTWTETDYDDFAPCGEPETTIGRSVKLGPTANPQDLTQTVDYDAFGNLLTESDWGARTTETNTYDIAGRLLTSTDSASVVSHTSYDCMGNATESYETATGTQMKADWTVTVYDALGRELTVTTKLSDASGNPTTQSVATSVYDGAGNLLSRDGTTLGGEDEATTYDASGNATAELAEGAYDAVAARTTRSSYDAQGNITSELAPGATSAATTSTYDDAGNLLSETQADGTKETYAYDGQGNTVSTEGGTGDGEASPWEKTSVYDYDATSDARLLKTTDADESHTGLVTTTTYDKLGRVVATKGELDGEAVEPETTTTYNDLGWVLQTQDANGVTTSTTYDAHGAVTSQTIGTKMTTESYNSTTGRLETVTTADGATVTYTYDAFGRVVRELHEQGAVTLKDIGGTYETTLDSLGRPVDQTEAVAAITHAWTYPVNAASGTQETIAYDAAPLTSLAITRNGREVETSRTATIASGVTATLSIADDGAHRDTADRWKQRTIQRTGYAADTENRSFDDAGRLSTQSGLGFSSAGSYAYDANSGRKTAESLPIALGGALAGSYTYYPGGSLAVATTNGTEESFTYDEVGNLVSDTVTDTGTRTLSYDSANRLTRSDYLEDTDGASAVTTYYGWDSANAWRTCQGPNASPTQTNSPIDLSYNALGRMSAYANSDTNTSASYTYDAAGQRTKKEVTVAGVTTTTSFAYDGLTLMKLSAAQGGDSWRIDYLYDEEGAVWGGVYRSPAGSTSPVYFTLVTSDRGDVVELCDGDGNPFAAYRYDAWGLPQGAGNYATGIWTQSTTLITSALAGQIASRQVLRYASYAWDSESALYYCSARYYDPATRQWTTGDPAKADGEESAYQYCGGEPVGGTDGSGERVIIFRRRRAEKDARYLRMVLRVNGAICARRHLPGGLPSEWYYNMVNTGGAWDFKRAAPSRLRSMHLWRLGASWISPEDFGNIHFGFTGRLCGLSRSMLYLGSWWKDGHHYVIPPQEYADRGQIRRGWHLAKAWGVNWSRQDIYVRRGTSPE